MMYQVGNKAFHSRELAEAEYPFEPEAVEEMSSTEVNVVSVFWTNDSNELLAFDPPSDCLPVADGNDGAEYLVPNASRLAFFDALESSEGLYHEEERAFEALMADISTGLQDSELNFITDQLYRRFPRFPNSWMLWDWNDVKALIDEGKISVAEVDAIVRGSVS